MRLNRGVIKIGLSKAVFSGASVRLRGGGDRRDGGVKNRAGEFGLDSWIILGIITYKSSALQSPGLSAVKASTDDVTVGSVQGGYDIWNKK